MASSTDALPDWPSIERPYKSSWTGVDPVKPWDKKGFKLPNGKIYSPQGFQFWPAANAIYRRETHDNYPGPRYLLHSVVEGLQLPMDLALQVESRYFAKVLQTPEAANMIRSLFVSMQELNKGARREIEDVVRHIEKIETAVEAGFQDQFVKAMAIPHQSEPYERLSAAVTLPERILTPDEAPAIESGRRRGGRRRGR